MSLQVCVGNCGVFWLVFVGFTAGSQWVYSGFAVGLGWVRVASGSNMKVKAIAIRCGFGFGVVCACVK